MSPASRQHQPVLLAEVLESLRPAAGEVHCDATVGAGGHAAAILQRLGADGLLVGVDRDREALELACTRLDSVGNPFRLVRGPFSRLREHLREAGSAGAAALDGLLLDLGVSSMQLDRAPRGFSFRQDGPLDMRMDSDSGPTAAELLGRTDERELTRIIREYGEEPAARRVARAVLAAQRAGELKTTGDLAAVVERTVSVRRGKIHPATRVFQAIRIAVNGELDELRSTLAVLDRVMRPGGRVVVLSYHSLEDRIVKRWGAEMEREGLFDWAEAGLRRPSAEEVASNPRARSARLRSIVRAGGRTPAGHVAR